MFESIGAFQGGDLYSLSSISDTIKEAAIKEVLRLEPDMKNVPLTKDIAFNIITCYCVPNTLWRIMSDSLIESLRKRITQLHRMDLVYVDKFKAIIENFYSALNPDERSDVDLVEKLYNQYQCTYTQGLDDVVQKFLDKEFGGYSHGSIAMDIYASALPIIKKNVEDTIDMNWSYYAKYHIKDFLKKKTMENSNTPL